MLSDGVDDAPKLPVSLELIETDEVRVMDGVDVIDLDGDRVPDIDPVALGVVLPDSDSDAVPEGVRVAE